MKKTILLIMSLILFSNFVFALTGTETMTRTASTTVAPGSTFQLTYTAVGVSGLWGATIVDSVSGGCQFPAGTTFNSVLLHDEGTTKTITITAPSTAGSCTFTGDYQYADSTTTYPIKLFPDLIVTVSGTPTTQTCSQQNGDICLSTETCSGTWLTASDTTRCCSVTCTTTTTPIEPTGWCKFAEKFAFIGFMDKKCTEGSIIIGIIGFFAIFLFSRMGKR